ncbi:DedA family protein [Ureibacillus sp. 179-F W5.1 NHS]|uniref:DedA family protein n=1 Tax=Ureibacillus sp. 179-F W5.1 NHS TaxID=3374297 RepID=UPI00387998F8
MSMSEIFELLNKLDSELYYYIDKFGIYIYFILFLIVFGKTGFVVLTFLPGDSLVFASGTIAAVGELNILLLFFLFFIATVLADSNNFFIGRNFGKIPTEKIKLISLSTIERAREFLTEYDKIAITFSRFIPLMRTMTPFIAGYSGYPYFNFVRYNVIGAFIWTCVWLGTGFALGNIQWVEENLFVTLLLITLFMFIPGIFGFISQFRKKHTAVAENSEL